MTDETMVGEYQADQRLAICSTAWDNKGEMMQELKSFVLKDAEFDDEAGRFKAVFATMNVVDADGDLTINGAFGKQKVIISGYGHASWREGVDALPVGKGKIYEDADNAIVEGRFFLDTIAGQETYKTVKNVGELQEFSYALPEIDYEFEERDGQTIRILKRIVVNEVSPVLMGVGVDTRLLDIKSLDGKVKLPDHISQVTKAWTDLMERLESVRETRRERGKDTPLSDETLPLVVEMVEAIEGMSDRLKAVSAAWEPEVEISIVNEFVRFQKLRNQGVRHAG
jgi:hypothetical protein